MPLKNEEKFVVYIQTVNCFREGKKMKRFLELFLNVASKVEYAES